MLVYPITRGVSVAVAVAYVLIVHPVEICRLRDEREARGEMA